jgi:hypothetical protein
MNRALSIMVMSRIGYLCMSKRLQVILDDEELFRDSADCRSETVDRRRVSMGLTGAHFDEDIFFVEHNGAVKDAHGEHNHLDDVISGKEL